MSMPRYNARVDANQKEIVKALEKIGCVVEVIGKPLDLLVGYRHHNFLIEVKNPESNYGRYGGSTDAQTAFKTRWRAQGQFRVLHTAEEAIELVTNAYKSA